MYKYETHLHTSPASKCGRYSVRDNLEFYKSMGYDGVFITNHFVDANIGCDRSLPYEEQIEFFFSDFEEGERIAEEIGIKCFVGIESSYRGADFLIYGLDKQWYLDHPEIMKMSRTDMLTLMAESGALIVQAHPYREAHYIEYIRLFPRHVHAVEVINCANKDFQNDLAEVYADTYGLSKTAGSDNHISRYMDTLAGVEFDTPLRDVHDFVERIKAGEGKCFVIEND